jgi:two-component system response regulator FlrC
VIATSNRDLAAEVAAGRFREDLYYRLNVFPLPIPPLKDRPADILPLARRSLKRAAQANDMAVPELSAAAEARLLEHGWPGNVRELDNMMQRACILNSGGRIEAGDLIFEDRAPLAPASAAAPGAVPAAAADSLGGNLKDRERLLILDALREGKGSRKFAAGKLGISARTLRYKLARMREEGVAIPGR